MIITHFTPRVYWQRTTETGVYVHPSLEQQGFIHCSTQEQVVPVANFIAKDWKDLVLLWIDEDKVASKIVYENLEGGDKLFPHIYGSLNIDAVIKVSDFVQSEEGEYVLPTF